MTVEWGVAQESRFTYNRRGRRPDGRSYFIREEDRVLLGEDYVGTIDPDATVVVFRGANGKPVAALASYTGHPVTGYNPEKMTSHGQWPQVACERLSAHLGGVPVGFLQGSCGDVNSKHMLTGTLAQADEAGEQLGESFIAAAGRLRKSQRPGLRVDAGPRHRAAGAAAAARPASASSPRSTASSSAGAGVIPTRWNASA